MPHPITTPVITRITDPAHIRAAFEADDSPALRVDVAQPDPPAGPGPGATLRMCEQLAPHLTDGMAMYAEPHLAIAIDHQALKHLPPEQVATIVFDGIRWLKTMNQQIAEEQNKA